MSKIDNKSENISKKVPISEYMESKLLISEPIKKTRSKVILLPNNKILHQLSENENRFTPITKEILLILKDQGVNASLYDDGKEKREIILRSAETAIFLPILIFTDKYLIPIALGILSTWIYNNWIKSDNESKLIEMEYGYFNFQKDIIETYRFKGQAVEVQKMINDKLNNFDNKLDIYNNNSTDLRLKNESKEDIREKKAQESMIIARKLISDSKNAIKNNDMEEAENLLRNSLVKIREAFLFTDEKKYQDKLYNVGLKIRNIFGCPLEFIDGHYNQTCPVELSNSTWGFSIGGSSKTICSICGENTLECQHINGEIYDEVLAQNLTDVCNICGKKECYHELGKAYNHVEAFSIILELHPDHVSLVERPADPLCSIMSHSIPKTDILKGLNKTDKEKFVYGKSIIQCDHCLKKKK
ncbi:hypothetical protein [Methanobacterium sp. SMA-27]|uniref:hypothetical protein n=1 Tax=Methanobacterium sp. SMA-27 TaxID=1495336 RepID=UPI0012E0072E|nr:hypothetical protein [Methanobacterium sp. SMA-27]